jgi:hypothetical protein
LAADGFDGAMIKLRIRSVFAITKAATTIKPTTAQLPPWISTDGCSGSTLFGHCRTP